MIIYTLLNITTFLLVSLSNPTSFVFDSPIEYVSISKDSDFYQYKSKDGKILSLKPTRDFGETGLLVITKKAAYTFSLSTSGEKRPMIFPISEGVKSKSFTVRISNSDYDLMEGDKIYLLRVKSENVKTINDLPAKTEQYLPKNSNIKINGVFISI